MAETVSGLARDRSFRGNWLFRVALRTVRFARRNPPAAVSVAIIALLTVAAILAPLIAPYDPYDGIGLRLQSPDKEFRLGTDELGRDVFSRLVYGARISLYISVVSVGVSLVLASAWGVSTAYFQGAWDMLSQRVVDMLGAFPGLLFALTIMSALGASINNVVIALIITFVPAMTRVIRSSALSVVARPYVEAARAVGLSAPRVMLRYILPNTMATVIILFSINLAYAVLIEASLSFLGAGTDPADPSWGGMLTKAAQSIGSRNAWVGIAPGIALSLAVMAFNLVGDALRDELDPKLRRT